MPHGSHARWREGARRRALADVQSGGLRSHRFHLPRGARAAGRLPFAAACGAAFAFGWSPCIGPTLGSILALAASHRSAGQGAALLAVFSLGLAIPFVVVGVAGVSVLRSPRFRIPTRLIRTGSGAFMVGAGLLLVSGQLSAISGRLASVSFL